MSEVTGVVSIDGKKVGILNKMRTDTKTGVIHIEAQSVSQDVELLTAEQALERELITQEDYDMMAERHMEEQDRMTKQASEGVQNE